jgi:hypothetical protein
MLGWGWVSRCRALGGEPTLEMFDEAVAGGRSSLTLLVDVLSQRRFREGTPDDCADLPVHALRIAGEIAEPASLPAILGVLAEPVDPTRYGEEAAVALSRLGALAFPSAERLLADRTNDRWVRLLAAKALALGAARDVALAASRDASLRTRWLDAMERALRDPLERDRELAGHLVALAVHAGAPELVPAMTSAYEGGRVDRDVIDEHGVSRAFTKRDGAPDPDFAELAQRDPRAFYRPWSVIRSGLDAEIADGIATRLATPDDPDEAPPP